MTFKWKIYYLVQIDCQQPLEVEGVTPLWSIIVFSNFHASLRT